MWQRETFRTTKVILFYCWLFWCKKGVEWVKIGFKIIPHWFLRDVPIFEWKSQPKHLIFTWNIIICLLRTRHTVVHSSNSFQYENHFSKNQISERTFALRTHVLYAFHWIRMQINRTKQQIRLGIFFSLGCDASLHRWCDNLSLSNICNNSKYLLKIQTNFNNCRCLPNKLSKKYSILEWSSLN